MESTRALQTIAAALLSHIEAATAAACQAASSADARTALKAIQASGSRQSSAGGSASGVGPPDGPLPGPPTLARHGDFMLTGMAQKSRLSMEAVPTSLGMPPARIASGPAASVMSCLLG